MAETKDKGDQLTVRLEPELRAAVERAAAREHRSLSGQIRHVIAMSFERLKRSNLREPGSGRRDACPIFDRKVLCQGATG
jgi:hypothetical protein